MTENEIKEMYKSLANGDEWECKCNGYNTNTCSQGEIGPCPDETWRPYKLGEAIHENFEYRKVEKWRVYRYGDSYFMDKGYYAYTIIYEGSKENCLKVLNKTYNSWIESLIRDKISNFKIHFGDVELSLYKTGVREGIKEFSKKILEEVDNHKEHNNKLNYEQFSYIFDIIKSLGVEV